MTKKSILDFLRAEICALAAPIRMAGPGRIATAPIPADIPEEEFFMVCEDCSQAFDLRCGHDLHHHTEPGHGPLARH
jgi:hypothetical protein